MKQSKVLWLVTIVASCTPSPPSENHIEARLNDVTLKYNEDLRETGLSDRYIGHFPEKITNLPIRMHPNMDVSEGCIYNMLFEFNVAHSRIDSLITALMHDNVGKYAASDSNIVIIKRKSLGVDVYAKTHLMPPIPFFETYSFVHPENVLRTQDVYDSSTESGLSKDFDIYVLASAKGKHWKGIAPSNQMPTGWENGYSKGIAVNDKSNIIIYWVIIW